MYVANSTIEVKYVYEKNPGEVTDEIVKKGPEKVNSINSQFDYSLEYKATVEEYVGEVTLELVDELPFTVKEVVEINLKM